MEFNLRKASAIQQDIKNALAKVEMNTQATVNEFTTDVPSVILEATSALEKAIMRKQQLTVALYNIRNAIARANGLADITGVMGEIQCVDALIAIHEGVIRNTPATATSEVIARLEKMRNEPVSERSSIYGSRYNNVEVPVTPKVVIQESKDAIKALRKKKRDLADRLLSLNITQQITIAGEDYDVLVEEGIV
jgi:hypothetical protein